MKKTFLRIISLVLCLTLLMGGSAFASAEGETAATDATPTRISIVFNGDSSTSRGFTWYTKANVDSKIEIADASGAAVEATVVYADVFEWEGNFVHKATVSGLAAGQTYTYRVGDGTTFSDWGSFITDNGDDKVEFITIADIQAGNFANFLQGAKEMGAAGLIRSYREGAATGGSSGGFSNMMNEATSRGYSQQHFGMERGNEGTPSGQNNS